MIPQRSRKKKSEYLKMWVKHTQCLVTLKRELGMIPVLIWKKEVWAVALVVRGTYLFNSSNTCCIFCHSCVLGHCVQFLQHFYFLFLVLSVRWLFKVICLVQCIILPSLFISKMFCYSTSCLKIEFKFQVKHISIHAIDAFKCSH